MALNTAFSVQKRAYGQAAHVFDALRDEIIALTIAPGTVLSRTEIQARFGVSSTPVRDALLRLEEEGLVEIYPQHATKVSLIDTARAREGQFLRRAVETEVVRSLAGAANPAGAEALRVLLRRQSALAAIADHEAFMQADRDFHRAMYEQAGAASLWPLVRRQGGHIDRLRRLNLPSPGKMSEILRDHERIVAAIERGVVDEAASVLRDHLSRSLGFIETLRRRHPDYFRA
jgi:DNA-binding GntR family transcriptional regulator